MRIFLILVLLFQCAVCFAGDINGVIRSTEEIQNDIWDDVKNCVRVRISPDSAFISNQLTSDTGDSGAAQVLSADTTACTKIIISSLPSNIGFVYIGESAASATASLGYIVSKDNSPLTLPVDSTDDVYMSTNIDLEGISWIAIVK